MWTKFGFFSSEQVNIYGEKSKCMYQYDAFMAILESGKTKEAARKIETFLQVKMKWNEAKECSTILMVSALAGELLSSIWWVHLD